MSSRYRRWSEKFEKITQASNAMNAPPPYSWTRVRTLNGAGVSSVRSPLAASSIRALRPPSSGLLSTQYTSWSTTAVWPTLTPPAATAAAVIGDRQLPNGAACGMVRVDYLAVRRPGAVLALDIG